MNSFFFNLYDYKEMDEYIVFCQNLKPILILPDKDSHFLADVYLIGTWTQLRPDSDFDKYALKLIKNVEPQNRMESPDRMFHFKISRCADLLGNWISFSGIHSDFIDHVWVQLTCGSRRCKYEIFPSSSDGKYQFWDDLYPVLALPYTNLEFIVQLSPNTSFVISNKTCMLMMEEYYLVSTTSREKLIQTGINETHFPLEWVDL
jgi:hypothetical protein